MTKRRKNAGALFMDFRISPDDRVGATPKKGRGRTQKPAKPSRRGARVEPALGSFDNVYIDEPIGEPPARGKPRGRAQPVKRARGRREKKPLRSSASRAPSSASPSSSAHVLDMAGG